MANENLKSRHAFGDYNKVDSAIADGKIDSYDVLFLKNGEKAVIGWVDKDGNKVLVEDRDQVVSLDVLPESGEVGVLYIHNEVGYIWNGTKFVNIAQSANISSLEAKVTSLETELASKVSEEQVTSMIEEAAAIEIVEF